MQGYTTEILFDKFEILEVLKKDEHAAVFLANHVYLSKKIILKVLNTKKISDHTLVERFKREAKLLAKLDHPNIIKVLDFGTSKEYFYISFEYIDGLSLRNLLRTKTLTTSQKEHLFVQLFKALDFSHVNNIIHRDIKPENIFIDNNFNLKLGDFGLALSSEESFVTNPYSIVGTPSYMSPEQVRGAKLTNQSDLFSAGVVLYELFTGKNPFLKDNVSLTLNEIMSYDESALPAALTGVPEKIRNVILKLLKKNPAQRYTSAAEVLGAFNIQPDQPTLVIPQQEKSREKRKRIILTVLALAVVVIVLLLFNRFWEPRSGGSEELIKNPISNSPTQGKIENQPSGNSEKTSGGEAQLQNDSDLTERQKTDSALNTNAVPQNNLPTKYGALVVDCNPWANIIIDGEQIQTTPLSRPISLPEGEYMLKLENPDYPIYSERIRIEGGETKRVRVSLASLLGYIAVKVYPWGDVYVNGDKKGQWPSKDIIKVVPGFVRVQVKNPYYDDIDTTFLISRGDTVSLRLSFKK